MLTRTSGPTDPFSSSCPFARAKPLMALASAISLWPMVPAHAAAAQDVEACLEAHERAYVARDAGDMLTTTAELRLCAASDCPPLVQRDCVEWLADVERSIPTVLVKITVEGSDKKPERFWIDDIEMDVPDEPLKLNPGNHVFRATARVGSEMLTRELSVLVQPSVRRQQITLDISEDPPPAVEGQNAGPAGDGGRRLRLVGFSLLGMGIATGVTTLGLGVSAIVDHGEFEERCAPFCDAAQSRSIQARFLAADVLGAFSGALLVTSAVLLGLGYRAKRAADGETASGRRKRSRSNLSVTPVASPLHVGVQVRW